MKKFLLLTVVMVKCTLMQVGVIHAQQDPGDRAAKLRGTWWCGVHPTLLDDKFLSLKTLDGFGVAFSDGATLSAKHYAPCPFLRGLDGGEELVPDNDDESFMEQISIIKNAGFMVKAYCNSEGFVGTNQEHLEEGAASFKNWCDTDPTAIEFVNSKSYHTKSGYPNRKYMFCYAEFVIKYYSLQYGQYIDAWIFDDGATMEENGDDPTSGNVEDQRIYEAFANAARAGNDNIAVAFNNGRSTTSYDSYPFAHATRFDDFTFGHAFGGNNNHAEKIDGNQFNLNYQHIERMTETNGYVHAGGDWTWDDKIVGNFHSKLSTTAWKYGPVQAWEQDDFNAWNAEALSAGGMMTWDGSYNRSVTAYYDWVYEMYKACDDYLYERGISIGVGNNNNLALEGTATQSSTSNGGVASLAIDGNTNGAWSDGSVTHTQAEDNAWWALDLGAEYSIDEIKIYNRTDACCTDRLSDFTVFVWDAEGNRTLRKIITTAPSPSVTISTGGIKAKSLRIKSNLAATALNLAEVEVYGTGAETTSARSSSEKLSIEEEEGLNMKLYPNPANNRVTIETPNILEATYSLFDYVGKTIITGPIQGGTALVDVSALKSGVYFIKVEGGQTSSTRKLIKK